MTDRLGAVGAVVVERPGSADRDGNEVIVDLRAAIDLPLIDHVLQPAGYRVVQLTPLGRSADPDRGLRHEFT